MGGLRLDICAFCGQIVDLNKGHRCEKPLDLVRYADGSWGLPKLITDGREHGKENT